MLEESNKFVRNRVCITAQRVIKISALVSVVSAVEPKAKRRRSLANSLSSYAQAATNGQNQNRRRRFGRDWPRSLDVMNPM